VNKDRKPVLLEEVLRLKKKVKIVMKTPEEEARLE
jgi:hypothetical protein